VPPSTVPGRNVDQSSALALAPPPVVMPTRLLPSGVDIEAW
jgi:hypothetical protein